jgi:hypothetical protein
VHWLPQLAGVPGSILRKVEFEIGEQFSVRKVPQAATCIGHSIGFPRDVIKQWDVTVMTLMKRLQT